MRWKRNEVSTPVLVVRYASTCAISVCAGMLCGFLYPEHWRIVKESLIHEASGQFWKFKLWKPKFGFKTFESKLLMF